MKKLDWIVILIALSIFLLGAIPAIATSYQFRPGAGQELMTLLLVGSVVCGFWWWVREFTYDKPSFKRREHKWEDSDSDDDES